MDRKLASIQQIRSLEPIEGADRIELATVMGWQVIVRKGEYKVGDPCVYFEIDSIVPDSNEAFHFITRKSDTEAKWGDARIKTMKMRGVISQGLALTPSVLGVERAKLNEDMTNRLGVSQYRPPEPHHVGIGPGKSGVKGGRSATFPKHLFPQTDEPRIQSHLGMLTELMDMDDPRIVITEKMDGTSASYAVTHEPVRIFGIRLPFIKVWTDWVCSRSRVVGRDDSTWHGFDPYHEMDEKYNITRKVRELSKIYGTNVAIQGEICGPKIQKNPLKLEEREFFVHNVYLIDEQEHADPIRMRDIAKFLGLQTVATVMWTPGFTYTYITEDMGDVKQWLDETEKNLNANQEGIVVRTIHNVRSKVTGERFSFKVINTEYLLKHDQ